MQPAPWAVLVVATSIAMCIGACGRRSDRARGAVDTNAASTTGRAEGGDASSRDSVQGHDAATSTSGSGIPDAAASQRAVLDAGVSALGWQGFLGGDDTVILRRICDAPVTRWERNRGGSTVSFRVWYEGGRGLFKPQQTNSVANFRAEIAAFRMSRLLGLHRTPPACGRVLSRPDLQRTADASGDPVFSERVMREVIARGDDVPGALLFWVPGPLENVPGTERWPELLDLARPLLPGEAELAADLSRLIAFDFIVDNVDRWSGGNILRQHLRNELPGPMLFMDNGASFTVGADGLGARPREQAANLARVGRWSRSLVAALRSLTAERIAEEVRRDPLGRALNDNQTRAVLTRRDRIITHVDALIRAHGEAAILVFP